MSPGRQANHRNMTHVFEAGVELPAPIYAYFNSGDDVSIHGWSFQAATYISYALGILALFGKSVTI